MKILFKLSWRNVWRNKRRSLVVISSIAAGIFFMIITMGFMNGLNNQMVDNTIRTSLGHIAIHKKGFQNDMKLATNFKPVESITKPLTALKKKNKILGFAQRLKIQGMIRSSETSQGVMIVGIQPDQEKKISSLYDYTSKKNGSQFLTPEDPTGILISQRLAKKLDMVLGDRLVIMFQNNKKELIGLGFTIIGFFTSPIESFDKYTVFTNLAPLQQMAKVPDRISEITILTNNSRTIATVQKSIIKTLQRPDLEILSWMDMAPNLVSAVKLWDQMMYVFFMIIFITVIFSIANTLIMAIMERYREFGVMKSIGTRPTYIFSMVMIEAINLGLVGLFFGGISGIILTTIFQFVGIDFSIFEQSMRLWGTGNIIYTSIKTADIIAAFIIVLITTIVAAVYPAAKAARIKPLDALHHI